MENHEATPEELIEKLSCAEIRVKALEAECNELKALLAESRSNDLIAMRYLQEVRNIAGGKDFPEMVSNVAALLSRAEQTTAK